jgi:hypothetical protein
LETGKIARKTEGGVGAATVEEAVIDAANGVNADDLACIIDAICEGA